MRRAPRRATANRNRNKLPKMTTFRQTRGPRDYFSRREQFRLLLLVMSLGLVVVLMSEARKEKHWRWLTGESGEEGSVEVAQAAPQKPRPEPRAKRSSEDVPGMFVAPARSEPSEAAASGDDGAASGYFPGVKPSSLESIRDKARFVAQEEDAWFHLFAVLAKTDPASLRKASIGRISRLQLSEQSKEYRGEVVTVRGTIRRAHWLRAPKNDYAVEGYYQTWLEPDDGSAAPIVVYCLELPEGFPVGMTLSEDVEATGFYFKRWLYKARDGLELAPVVLARSVQRRAKTAPASAVPGGIVGLIVVVGGALVLAAVVVGYVVKRTGKW